MATYRSAEDLVAQYLAVRAEALPMGERVDTNSKARGISASVGTTRYKVYPWGGDNQMPHKMVELLRSNTDLGNLLDTRVDFLFGSGLGVFRRYTDEVTGELKTEPYWTKEVFQYILDNELDEMCEAAFLNLVQLNNAFVNVSIDKGGVKLTCKDATTVRAVEIDKESRTGKVENYILAADWSGASLKGAVVVPAHDYAAEKDLSETIVHLRPKQPGQPYYAYAIWWGLDPYVKAANLIASNSLELLKTEGNLGNIIHIARKYFQDVMSENPVKEDGTPFTEKELIDAFNKTIDALLAGGKRMNVTDICAYDPTNGKLVKLLEIEPVKRTFTGNEYKEMQLAVITALINGSKMMGSLSNISDGKMNSGGGTEIRVSAEYQQFYRTTRERGLVLRMLNRIVRPRMIKQLSLPGDVFFDFKNIRLQTLDQNKSGVEAAKLNNV